MSASNSTFAWRVDVAGTETTSEADREAWSALATDLGALDENGTYYLRRYRAAEMLVFALRAYSATDVDVRLSHAGAEATRDRNA